MIRQRDRWPGARNDSDGGGAPAPSPVRMMIAGCLRGCIEAAEAAGDGAAVEACGPDDAQEWTIRGAPW